MNYFGMPFGMWTLLAKSFRTQLTKIFGYNDESARDITHKAKAKYKEIISELPEFEKGDRFKMNLQLCNDRGVHPFHATAPGDGQPDGLLRKIHDDNAHAVVLP